MRMNKAILLIDMPSCCVECPCYENTLESCSVTDDCAVGYGEIKRLDNCPLKPMPKQLMPGISEEYVDYCQGFNDCINEILGGDTDE